MQRATPNSWAESSMRSQLPRSTMSPLMNWPQHRSGSTTTGTIGSIARQRTLGLCELNSEAYPSIERASRMPTHFRSTHV